MTSDSRCSYVILLRSFGCKRGVMLRLLLFSSSHFFPFHLTSLRRSSLLPEGDTHHFSSFVSSDSYLHRLVLSRRLRNSRYSSFPSCSFPFYADASLRLGQALLGPCAFSLFYINQCTSCIISLTLTYSILPSNIPKVIAPCPGSLLVFIVLLSRCFSETFEPPASVLTLEPLKNDS